MSRKGYGLGKEREMKKLLYKEGALEVCRARGSFGNFDIIAFFPNHCLLVSVKSTKQKRVSFMPEVRKLFDVMVPDYCKKQLRIYWSPHKDRDKRGWETLNIG